MNVTFLKSFSLQSIILICLCLGERLQAQDRKNELSLRYGVQHQVRQDLLFSPLLYEGLAVPNLGLGFQRTNSNSIHQIGLTGSLYNMKSGKEFTYLDWFTLEEKEGLSSSFLNIRLNYAFLKKIWAMQKLTLWVGGNSANEIDAFFYEFGRFGTFGYTGIFSLNPTVQLNYGLFKEDQLLFQVETPVIAWVARSPFAVNDDEFIQNQSLHKTFPTLTRLMADGEIQTFNQLKTIQAQVGYKKRISSRFSLQGLYQFRYQYLKKPRSSESVQNNFQLLLNYKF